MAVRIGGPGVPLNLSANAAFWSRAVQGGAGYGFNQFSLSPGAWWQMPPGEFNVVLGPTTALAVRDAVSGTYKAFGPPGAAGLVSSDGGNFRLVNLSGVVTGVTVTAGGTLYTSPPTVTPSAGGATFQAVVGGAVALAVGAGGTGYTYIPQVIIAAPPPGGVQASAHAAITAGAVTGIALDNPGAGYSTPPQVLIIRDPRDTTGSGATLTATLTGAGTVTAVLVTDFGAYGGGTLPTLAFAGGGGSGAAATAIQAAGTGTADTSAVQPI